MKRMHLLHFIGLTNQNRIRAEIIDPYNQRVAKSTIATRGFRKVCSLSFDFYMKYLKTRNNLYFTRARRLVMEN